METQVRNALAPDKTSELVSAKLRTSHSHTLEIAVRDTNVVKPHWRLRIGCPQSPMADVQQEVGDRLGKLDPCRVSFLGLTPCHQVRARIT